MDAARYLVFSETAPCAVTPRRGDTLSSSGWSEAEPGGKASLQRDVPEGGEPRPVSSASLPPSGTALDWVPVSPGFRFAPPGATQGDAPSGRGEETVI